MLTLKNSQNQFIIFYCADYMESIRQEADQDFQEGRWTQDEHTSFLKGIMLHGKDWKIVETMVQSRLGSQVRSHAQKFFIKLNKISKDRKRAKSREVLHPTQIQKQILRLFNENDITENTPQEITYVLKRDWTIPQNLTFPKKQPRRNKHVTELKKLSTNDHSLQRPDFDSSSKNISESEKEIEINWSEQSFFIQILKMSRQHLLSGDEFKNLIDFGQRDLLAVEQPQTSINNTIHQGFHSFPQNFSEKERKQSFGLPNEQEDPEKLKQTLNDLHKALKQ